MRWIVMAAVGLALAGCATTAPRVETLALEDMFSGSRQVTPQLTAAIAAAAKHPLGSRENPVRVNMPLGERAYLDRLRCSDGKAPRYSRTGNFGIGVFGSIIDGYQVICTSGAPKEGMIFMDMYHPAHDERAAPAGFTIVPAGTPPGTAA